MTGQEFEAAVKAAGYTQKRFAETMGVHRTTIADRFVAETVEPFWVYALAGLIAGEATGQIAEIVVEATGQITDIVAKANINI